ncbi:Secreted RxLR effector peptide protein [Phytophthora palmivora]|uniref:RxLR effector protein n=1 Tax=Phytophthora palmivora TaxID=4796 RepID=A0A2P4X3M1_9STRA|nr:Secreted RxLR effector peptide protein [Phytophthora palmivora]
MRFTCFLVGVSTILLTSSNAALADTNMSKQLQLKSSSVAQRSEGLNDSKRHLRQHIASDDTIQNEERAIDMKWMLEWTYFTKSKLYKMLRDEQFRFKMFAKWDEYPLDQLRLKIGEAKLQDERLAAMFMSYVRTGRRVSHHSTKTSKFNE